VTGTSVGVRIERTAAATWSGSCGLDDRHPIRPGDRVGHSEHGWLCTECTEAGAR
jgi:hypothetical protein